MSKRTAEEPLGQGPAKVARDNGYQEVRREGHGIVKVSQRRLAFLAARGPLRPPGALLRRRTLATRRRAVSKVRLWAWWAVMRLRGAQPWQARNAMLAHMHAAQSRKSCP